MTIRELVEKLMDFPEDMEVRVAEYDFDTFKSISDIDIQTVYEFNEGNCRFLRSCKTINGEYGYKNKRRIEIPCESSREIVVIDALL